MRQGLVPGCKVEPEACPQFTKLREYWKKHGYPSIDTDLVEAFQNISKDIQANHGREMPRFSALLGGRKLFKYRQKNSGAREGARGGWRIIAILVPDTAVLYPIIVYPKKEWPDADDDTVKAGIKEIIAILTSMFSV